MREGRTPEPTRTNLPRGSLHRSLRPLYAKFEGREDLHANTDQPTERITASSKKYTSVDKIIEKRGLGSTMGSQKDRGRIPNKMDAFLSGSAILNRETEQGNKDIYDYDKKEITGDGWPNSPSPKKVCPST